MPSFFLTRQLLPEETKPMVAGLAAQGVEALAGVVNAVIEAA